MTSRQVDICLRKIRVRNHNAFAKQATLHGLTVPMIQTQPQEPEGKMTDVDQGAIDRLLRRTLEEKRKEKLNGPK